MPTVFHAPEVEDYFVTFDLSSGEPPYEAILEAYEDGKVVILQGLRLKFDAAFFAGLDFKPNRTAKKLKSRADAEGRIDVEALRRDLARCAPDEATTQAFMVQADRLARQVMPVMTRIFPYAFNERRITWRMLETVHEDLHLDTYAEERPEQQARMFVNLDSVARIWHTSHRLDHLLAVYGDRLTQEELWTFPVGKLIATLNERVYGGLPNAGRDGEPRHAIFFQPGDVWLVDSRKVSHQIYYGRRAISVDLFAPAESMRDPHKHYVSDVIRFRERRFNS